MWLLITFILVWAFSPGPLTVVTVNESRKKGLKEGVAISAGAALMCSLMVLAAVIMHNAGFTSLFESSRMKLVEQIGALGIIGMGVFTGYKSLLSQDKEAHEAIKPSKQLGFMKGFLMMGTYIPQALIFYGLIVPKTVDPQLLISIILVLGALKTVLMFGWHAIVSVLTTRAQQVLNNNSWGKVFERSAACMIILFGVRILV